MSILFGQLQHAEWTVQGRDWNVSKGKNIDITCNIWCRYIFKIWIRSVNIARFWFWLHCWYSMYINLFFFLCILYASTSVSSYGTWSVVCLLSDELDLFQLHIILLLLKHVKKGLQILKLKTKLSYSWFKVVDNSSWPIRIWENSNSDAVNKRSPRYHAYFR